MVKTILINFLLFTCIWAAKAQRSFHVSKQSVLQRGNFNKEVRPNIIVRNLQNKPITLKWQVKKVNLTDGWNVVVCDKQCYTARELSGSFTLAPKEVLQDFSVSFRPNGKTGLSSLELILFDEAKGKNSRKNIEFNADASSSISTLQKLQKNTVVSVYPNPATQYIQVRDIAQNIQQVEVYNIMGRKMLNFKLKEKGEKLDISSLPRGMYMVRILNQFNTVLRTQRISKYNP